MPQLSILPVLLLFLLPFCPSICSNIGNETRYSIEEIDCSQIFPHFFNQSDNGDSDPSYGILVVTPSKDRYFGISSEFAALCLAINYSNSLIHTQTAQIRLYYYVIDYSCPIDCQYLNSTLRDDEFNISGVIGPDLAPLSNVLIKTGSDNGVNFVSYGASILSLQGHNLINNGSTFKIIPEYKHLSQVLLEIFQHYDWTRGVLLYEPLIPEIRLAAEKIYMLFSESKISLHDKTLVPSTNCKELDNLAKATGPEGLDQHVFILLLDDEIAAKTVCSFFRNKMYGSDYVILGLSYWNRQLWQMYYSDCQPDDLDKVLDYGIYVSPSGIGWSQSSVVTDAGLTPSDFLVSVDNLLSQSPLQTNQTKVAHAYDSGLIADSVWVLLDALNKTLDEHMYVDARSFHESMTNHLGETMFLGVSGEISFDPLGNRSLESSSAYAVVFQSIQIRMTAQMEVRLPNTVLRHSLQFEGGKAPSTTRELEITNMKAVDLLILVPSALGIVFCLLSCSIYFAFRRKPAIAMSSPNINILCGLASCVSFATILIHMLAWMKKEIALDPRSNSSHWWGCDMYEVCIRLGFTTSLACLVCKLYRVHAAITTPRRTSVPSDTQIIWAILGITTIQTIVHGTAVLFYPPTFSEIGVNQSPNSLEPDYIYFFICNSDVNVWRVTTGNFINVVLLVYAVYFSWTTRKVKVSVLNESHKVETVIMTIIALETLNILSSLTFKNASSTIGAYFALSENVIFEQWVIVCHVFVPGMIRLARKPDWKPETPLINAIKQQKLMRGCVDEISRIRNVEDLLGLYLKTFEMWQQISQMEERFECIHTQTRQRSNSQPDVTLGSVSLEQQEKLFAKSVLNGSIKRSYRPTFRD